jgi:hypothetical protein
MGATPPSSLLRYTIHGGNDAEMAWLAARSDPAQSLKPMPIPINTSNVYNRRLIPRWQRRFSTKSVLGLPPTSAPSPACHTAIEERPWHSSGYASAW